MLVVLGVPVNDCGGPEGAVFWSNYSFHLGTVYSNVINYHPPMFVFCSVERRMGHDQSV